MAEPPITSENVVVDCKILVPPAGIALTLCADITETRKPKRSNLFIGIKRPFLAISSLPFSLYNNPHRSR
jgi:hypothetical protein